LLKVLVAQPGRIYSRDQLMDAMYRDERVVSDRTVDSHVKKIRKKISDVVPDREIIHSVYGVGYKYEWT
jgi:two-component system response regulator BaeR